MSNTARKARKRAEIKFEKAPKVGTPREERAVPMVQRKVKGVLRTLPSARALKRIKRQQDAAAGRSRWNKNYEEVTR